MARYKPRDRLSPVRFGATIFANAINLEGVAGRQVVIATADFLFELADFLRDEFDGTAALGTHHVVVAAAVVLVLIPGNAIVESHFARKSALGQELQRAVDGGVPDAGIFLLYKAMKFIGGKVVAGFQKGAQNRVTLAGLFEADFFQVAMKNVLSFADHLAGDGGLVINAVLQHGTGSG